MKIYNHRNGRIKLILEVEINPSVNSNWKFRSNSPYSGNFVSPKFYQSHTKVNTLSILSQSVPLMCNVI